MYSGGLIILGENIERILREENQEKKRIGYGAYNKRGKGVKHGFNSALKTPYYFMKTKERNKLNGEVQTYNIFDLIGAEEFFSKSHEDQKMLLIKWREAYTNDQIRESLNMSVSGFSKMITQFELPKKQRGGFRARKAKTKKTIIPARQEKVSSTLEMVSNETPIQVKPTLLTKGLNLEYNNDYTAEEIVKILTKLQIIVEGEENKFSLYISLSEKL